MKKYRILDIDELDMNEDYLIIKSGKPVGLLSGIEIMVTIFGPNTTSNGIPKERLKILKEALLKIGAEIKFRKATDTDRILYGDKKGNFIIQ